MTDRATLTALAEKLEAVRPHLCANPAAPIVDEAIATLRSLAAGGEGQDVRASSARMIDKHRKSLEKLALSPVCHCYPRIGQHREDCHFYPEIRAGQGHAATPATMTWYANRSDGGEDWRCTRCRRLTSFYGEEPKWCPVCDGAPEPPAALDREALVKAVQYVVTKFQKDESDGYRSRDRQFAIEILSAALRPAPDREETGR